MYHIDKNGMPAKCTATIRSCPLGGKSEHFDSLDEAQGYADKQNAERYDTLAFGGQRPVLRKETDNVSSESLRLGPYSLRHLDELMGGCFVYEDTYDFYGKPVTLKGTRAEINAEKKKPKWIGPATKDGLTNLINRKATVVPPTGNISAEGRYLAQPRLLAKLSDLMEAHPTESPKELMERYGRDQRETFALKDEDCEGRLIGGFTFAEAMDREPFLLYQNEDGNLTTRSELGEIEEDHTGSIAPPELQPKCIREFAKVMYNYQEREKFNKFGISRSIYRSLWYRHGERND